MQPNSELEALAARNMQALKDNRYPGRDIIVATDETGQYGIIAYAIMGRGPDSRNRIFVAEEKGGLRTAQADPSKGGDLDLIIYTAMLESGKCFAVSNGKQTHDALMCISDAAGLASSRFHNWSYEPDKPNYTPRISATILLDNRGNFKTQFSILKKSPFGEECDRQLFNYDRIAPGYGRCLHTYKCDGKPVIPSFEGEPYLLPIRGDIKEVTQTIWDALNEDNRVSLAVKFIDLATGESSMEIINKYELVDAAN